MDCVVATVVAAQQDAEATYAFVTDAENVLFLQNERRIYGTSEGLVAAAASTPPRLRLALEEMAVGVTKGFLRLEAAISSGAGGQLLAEEMTRQLTSEGQCRESDRDAIWTISQQRRAHLRVFQDLWERGYIVTFGSKFGADFLIYKDDPKHAHAVALVVVKDYGNEFARVDVVSFCRVAKMVKKQLLFACVHPDRGEKATTRQEHGSKESGAAKAATGSVVYISLTHALLVSRQEEKGD